MQIKTILLDYCVKCHESYPFSPPSQNLPRHGHQKLKNRLNITRYKGRIAADATWCRTRGTKIRRGRKKKRLLGTSKWNLEVFIVTLAWRIWVWRSPRENYNKSNDYFIKYFDSVKHQIVKHANVFRKTSLWKKQSLYLQLSYGM